MSERELRNAGRYEWEQIVRRARLTGAIGASARTGKNGKATKGGISASTFKAVALTYASYANDKGAEIWPGDATIAVDLECALKTVTAVKKAMLELGLMARVAARRPGHGDEYRLTLPVDLLDELDVLTPAQHKLAARQLRDERRGKPGGSDGRPNNPTPGGPPDPPNEPEAESPGGSVGPTEAASGGSVGPTLGGPTDPRTDHDRTRGTTTGHPDGDLDAELAVPCAQAPHQDPISRGVDDRPPLPAKCPHGLKAGYRADGTHRCALCRVENRNAEPEPEPPPDPGAPGPPRTPPRQRTTSAAATIAASTPATTNQLAHAA